MRGVPSISVNPRRFEIWSENTCTTLRQIKRGQAAAVPVSVRRRLEPQMGAERNLQVIPGSAREIDLVAYLGTQADMAPESLDAKAGIDCKTSVPRINIAEGLGNTLIATGEVHKTHLAGGENIGIALPEVKLGPEKAVKRTYPGDREIRCHAVVKEVGLVAFEVVRDFAFNARPGIYVETSPATHTNEVDCVSPVKAVVLTESADFHMVFCLCKG
jgi:hypothetical protein